MADNSRSTSGAQRELEFWFDFASTYSYPAAMRIEHLAAQHGVRARWRAFLLGAIFNAQGWDDSPFNIYPAKGRYMWRDLQRVCVTDGLQFRPPTRFPRNGLLAARIVSAFSAQTWIGEFVRSVYMANFARDLDIADAEVISSCIDSLGQDATSIRTSANAESTKLKLREHTTTAASLGIFGAPSFIARDELFWGNDRLDEAIAWAVNDNTLANLPDAKRLTN